MVRVDYERCWGCRINVSAGDVLGESAAARCGEGDKGLRLAGNKGFLNGDVARLLDRGQMRAEVAVGERELRLEIGEVHLLARARWLSAAMICRRTG